MAFSHEEGDGDFLVGHAPAEVFERCGEMAYSPAVIDEPLKFARGKFRPEKKLEVPVSDSAETC